MGLEFQSEKHKNNQDVEGKRCPSCKAFLSLKDFGKNKSKKDGLESSCKRCVSKRKKASYKVKKNKLKRNNSESLLDIYVQGVLDEDAQDIFIKLIQEAYRGLKYENKL